MLESLDDGCTHSSICAQHNRQIYFVGLVSKRVKQYFYEINKLFPCTSHFYKVAYWFSDGENLLQTADITTVASNLIHFIYCTFAVTSQFLKFKTTCFP